MKSQLTILQPVSVLASQLNSGLNNENINRKLVSNAVAEICGVKMA